MLIKSNQIEVDTTISFSNLMDDIAQLIERAMGVHGVDENLVCKIESNKVIYREYGDIYPNGCTVAVVTNISIVNNTVKVRFIDKAIVLKLDV